MWNDFDVLLPEESVAVHVTVVVLIANKEPDPGSQATFGAGSTRSVADTVKVTLMPDASDVCTVMSPGTVRTGAVVSRTCTSKLARLVLPSLSDEEQLTVVWPRGNVEPEAGAQVTGTAPSTASVAVTV